jgi:hypothetical protein
MGQYAHINKYIINKYIINLIDNILNVQVLSE